MKAIRIGIFGAGRGVDLSKNFMLLNCDVVALCDYHDERREAAVKKLGSTVASYKNFDEFIEHGMDAVILANDFGEHAPYAIECMRRGIHVFSECVSNITMAEGVALIREFEKSNAIYMLAENYPDMIFNREMRRIVEGGTLGKILYAEGEYNHPVSEFDMEFMKRFVYYPKHWRNYIPATYYITHALGPVMRITGATPKRVSAFSAFSPDLEDAPSENHVGDRFSAITTLNDDGSIFRVAGWAKLGAHHNSYRVCGTKGQVENLRGMGNKIMLRYNEWDKPCDLPEENCYTPKWNDPDEALIAESGHDGGDFLTARRFINCIKCGTQPEHPYDIHSAVTMSSVAILAHRSVLGGGAPYDIPDFHKEEDRIKYENDNLSPIYGKNGEPPTIPSSSHPGYEPTEKQKRLFREMVMGEKS